MIRSATANFSIVASASAGIGAEITFRGFVLGLWTCLLNLLLRRRRMTGLALRIANVIAALAFAAGHLPTAMVLYKVASPAELPGLLVAEVFVLNTVISLAAGWRYMASGLVTAIGIHFCADIVWHVLWPLLQQVRFLSQFEPKVCLLGQGQPRSTVL